MALRAVSIVATALICAAPAAFGGSMSATPIAIDLTKAPDIITLPDISMTFGSDLRYQDGVTIFVDGADAAASSNPFNFFCEGYSGQVFGYVQTTQHSWEYRATGVDGIGSGTICTFRELQVGKSSLARNCSVSVRYEAINPFSGSILDSGGPITVATCTGKPPGAMHSVLHAKWVYASAAGSYCSWVEDQQMWRCRSFEVTEYRESTGKRFETLAKLRQWRNWPNGYAEREVICPVPRQALKVLVDKASVETTFDADSPDCTGYGVMVTFDPYTVTEWRYTGPQTLQADLLAPALQDRRVTSYWFRDNQLGTSTRENCHGGMGVDPQSGGFTMIGRYQAFGPGEAGGSFYYDTCGSTSK